MVVWLERLLEAVDSIARMSFRAAYQRKVCRVRKLVQPPEKVQKHIKGDMLARRPWRSR
jgi:hypothetical protein